MKKHLHTIKEKMDGWNLVIGMVVGFVVGVCGMNVLIPNANEVIKMYHYEYKRHMREDTLLQGTTTPRVPTESVTR